MELRNFLFWRVRFSLLLACILISGPSVVWCQETPAVAGVAPTPDPAVTTAPAEAVRISGQLLEKGTKRPIEGVNIFLLPLKIKATTDEKGRFVFDQVVPGDLQAVVNASGYLRLERTIKVGGEASDVRLFLERESYLSSFETKVVAQDTKKDAASRSLDYNRFSKAVGGLGDPVRAVQDLPGVNRSTAGAANILIQGSGPNDTKYLIEGHEVPLMFHFGGVSSVVFPESAERIELLAAGYGPEYGRALGGLVGAWTRRPDSPRLKGQAYMDIFNAGGYVEGQAGDRTHFFFGIRRSYFGEVLGAAFKGNSNFDFVAAPNFGDVTAIVAHRLNDEHTLKLTALGSQDTLQFVLAQPVESDPSIRGKLSNQISFYRLIPKWEWKRGADSVISASSSVGQDRVALDSDDNFIRQTSTTWSLRSEWQERWNSLWKTYIGIDNAYSWFDYDVQFPNRFSQGGIATPSLQTQVDRSTRTAKVINVGVYLRNELHAQDSDWTFYPNVRLDYLGVIKKWLPAPRLNFRYDIDSSIYLRFGTGLYYQSPAVRESDPVFGNPDIQAPRSIHAVVGVEKDFREGAQTGLTVASDLFFRHLDSQIISSQDVVARNGALVPKFYSNDGTGRVYGMQTQVKYNTFPWNFELAYTWSRSFRTNPTQGEYPFQFDQNHLVGFFGSREFEGNWRIAWRMRYATGNPYTPIVGSVYDADSDLYVPIRGPFYSQRLDPFFQTDLRVDKKWIQETWVLSAYLDVLNLLNTKNSEGTRYSYDYSQSEVVQGLPLLPAIGVKGEF